MTDVIAALKAAGVNLRSYSAGNHYTTCPVCSHTRKGAHKSLRCLSVKIDESGAVWNCHHCGYTDHANDQRKTPGSYRGPRDQPGTRDVYGSLQRQALTRWVRRA